MMRSPLIKRHAVVVLQPVLIVRRDALCLSPPVLERVRVRREHSQAPSCERRAKCQQGVPGKPCDFAFSEVEFASVLVKYHHAPNRVGSLGNEQVRRDLSPVVAFISDGFIRDGPQKSSQGFVAANNGQRVIGSRL